MDKIEGFYEKSMIEPLIEDSKIKIHSITITATRLFRFLTIFSESQLKAQIGFNVGLYFNFSTSISMLFHYLLMMEDLRGGS
ncbi:MAG: hypothetical protein R2809_13965 [Flavobacteriales bacterium]